MAVRERSELVTSLSAQKRVAAVTETALDLTSCDREPIHIPGSIQPHGFLLALDPTTLRVVEASANAEQHTGRVLEQVFGADLEALFGSAQGARMRAELRSAGELESPRLLTPLALSNADGREPRPYEAVAHRAGSQDQARVIVECEEIREPFDAAELNGRLHNFVAANRGKQRGDLLLQAAVKELRSLTGCDRVVLYHFDEEGHGVVLAEDRGSQFASYLGLRFPASDVPKQARRMYELNRVRIIPEVNYEPSPVVSRDGEVTDLDLSFSVLRSVSPVHRAYMRNMGTACSMSVSILVEGKLWGLVSCHHHLPLYVPLRMRSACDFVMQIVSAQLESERYADHLRRMRDARAIQARLLSAMSSQDEYIDGLLANGPLLMELLHAEGAAVVQKRTAHIFGQAPEAEQVLELTDWLRQQPNGDIFSSSHLVEVYPPAAAFAASGSGAVAVSLSKIHNAYVFWFRPELVSAVRWAGDPHKPAAPAEGGSSAPGVTVSPRHSFEEWTQIVRARSSPWTPEEVAAAAELRSAVLEIVLKRVEEIAELVAGLKVANAELEAFSYSVSHDLRAPFRHISGFSELLQEQEAGRMSEKGRRYLDTIMDSARFAGRLVDSLLDFSRIGRTKLLSMPMDLADLVDAEWEAVKADEGQGRSIAFRRSALPCIQGDPSLLRVVVRNLLSNAVKYTARVEQAQVAFDARLEGGEYLFSVADNGAGFDPVYAGKLFGVFQRLHRAEEFEGTGIGLAGVRRIVHRHGGRTWAEGEVGRGATFYFTLPTSLIEENR